MPLAHHTPWSCRKEQLRHRTSKLDRIAVVSDTDWIRTAAEIEGKLIPGLDIRAFRATESDAAEAWLGATA